MAVVVYLLKRTQTIFHRLSRPFFSLLFFACILFPFSSGSSKEPKRCAAKNNYYHNYSDCY